MLSSSSWLLSGDGNDRKFRGLPDIKQPPIPTSSMNANSNAWLAFLRFAYAPTPMNHIPDLPPAEEFALELAPAVLCPGAAALLDGDLPLPPLSPVGFEPLLNPVVPLPGLSPVGFDPLLEPVPAAGLALPAGAT
jgi:hypothetical protein